MTRSSVCDEGLESSCLQVAEGDCHAVGSVVGMGRFIEIQELPDHRLHLEFVGFAVAC